MENLYVSDLFGYNVTNGSPAIIMNVNNTQKIFSKIAYDLSDNTSIWKYNKSSINDILTERNIDPNNFLILGHILCKSNVLPKNIILVNKNICTIPQQYDEVTNYHKGKIIRPYSISNKGKKTYSVGLFYSDKQDFDMSQIGIVPDKLLVSYTDSSSKSRFDCNEFGILTSAKFGIKTLARTQEVNDKFKLLNGNDKYLTVLDSGVMTKQGMNEFAQTFSYNAQGELIIDGKCLAHKDAKILAESCDSENLNQKWIMSQNKILPSNNFGKCLDVSALDKTTVQLNDCDSVETQQWDTEIESNKFDNDIIDISSSQSVRSNQSTCSGDYTWGKYKGKTIALVENDNPWFVNSDIVTIAKMPTEGKYDFEATQVKSIPQYQPNYLINMRNNQPYKTNFVIDPESPTLGYGYSFLSRGGKPCQKSNSSIEHFDGTISEENSYSTDQQIIMIITFIAVLLILYKIWKFNQ